MPHEDESPELTEREWRDMRRRMPSLQFDPVPETPELLPRSLYGGLPGDQRQEEVPASEEGGGRGGDEEIDGERGAGGGSGAASPVSVDVVMLESCASTDNDVDSVEVPAVPAESEELTPMLEFSVVKSPAAKTNKQPKASLSSSCPSSLKPTTNKLRASAVSPVKKLRRRSSVTEKEKSTSGVSSPSTSSLNHTSVKPAMDLSTLETTITTAQNTLRLTILTAVEEATTRLEREAMLEKRKLEAANANRVAELRTQIEELQAETQSQQQQLRQATQSLDRVSRLMMKWKQRERHVWRNPHSVHACFQAWRLQWQRKKHEHTQQQFASAFSKKQSSQTLLQQWKLLTQQTTWEKKLQALQDEHRAAIDTLVAGHAAQLKAAQEALETAQRSASVAKQGRQAMEDDLRQVFLRGVSAMNIEALTMFKSNHQLTQQRRVSESHPQEQEEEDALKNEANAQAVEAPPIKVSDATSTESDTVLASESVMTLRGGESSEELPSEERMIPVKPPTPMIEDPRIHFQPSLVPPLQPGVMPSYAIANRLLKNAGTSEVVSALPRSEMEVRPPPPPPTAAIHGLRSAELVEAHQRVLHATISAQQQTSGTQRRESSSSSSTSSYPRPLSPAKQREKAQSSMRFHVEMELMRSSVETAAYNARFAPATATTSAVRNTSSLRSSRHSNPSLSTQQRSSSTRLTGKWRSPS